ncbi:16S rRNA (cytidine(1402)-2'-O)-methyltransferase [Bacillota bacterium LX-D]|nr:16S rRNA (cytidine(1402)-2'-O)-methyltransferase [Bacillota bacterium LX-D]
MEKKAGSLYLVGTPIGNLEDMTFRAVKVLQEVDLIAAEDTRHSRKLLTHYDIHTPLTSYFQHNQKAKGPILIEQLLQGQNIALITDAGMPGISDPGYDLVVMAQEQGIQVIPIPGPSASIAALVVSGLPTDRYAFEGFLPREEKVKKARLEQIRQEERTLIFYEAPHRLKKTLSSLFTCLGDRKAAAAREITKKYEEVQRGTIGSLLEYYQHHDPKGEFTLIVAGREQVPVAAEKKDLQEIVEEIFSMEAQGLDRKVVLKELAQKYSLPKRELYQAVIATKEKNQA